MSDFIWEVQQRADKYARGREGLSWSIRQDVTVYYNPEFRCPYCNGGFPTRRLWMVDEQRQKILGCWYLDDPERSEDGKLSLRHVGNDGVVEVVHPHADHYGTLCMGNATSVFQLLFHSIAPGKHHRHTDRFLLNVGHNCPFLPKSHCRLCNTEYLSIDTRYYNLEPMCSEECVALARSRFCYGCYTPLAEDREERHGSFCPTCFEAIAKTCSHCGGRGLPDVMRMIRLGQRVCQRCYENESGLCSNMDCRTSTPYRQLADNHHRGRCDQCQILSCVSCHDSFVRSDLNEEMRCASCEALRPRPRIPDPEEIEEIRPSIFSSPAISEWITNSAAAMSSEEPILFLRGNEVQTCNESEELSLPELEESDTGSSGVSAETLQEPE